ncbi:FkbM family methyltransferase [Dinghuibacter silviterrae]|uniref:FkbM family methyltransferase n=1 Tax=Dinghuibacter silviterrae TaxID=1539049 RepID=A0A4R8DS58_9BACT|nr:FkbM family methyltransferase [Dinghuibacter silviterrae]TDX00255.1 FkbM family methyltransferase [Dinghuibacter silviterrae]
MSWLKGILIQVLGERRYLQTLCSSFQRFLRLGWLNKSFYRDVYFLKEYIRPGDTCIDIGAHLGYYSFELCRLSGETGAVYAVEPISKFNSVIERYMRRHAYPTLRLFKVALGGDGGTVAMGIPQVGARKRFAYAKIIEKSDAFDFVETEQVRNEDPNELFGHLPKIDFIKCDVEGFEVRLFAKMQPTVARYRPMIVCELNAVTDRADMARMLEPLGYACYFLEGWKWRKIDAYGPTTYFPHNYYYLTAEHIKAHKELVGTPLN